jgi:Flp pilus assembly protein TadD
VSALSHQGLGSVLSQSGQLNQAVEHYRQAGKIKPNTPRVEKSLNLALSKKSN